MFMSSFFILTSLYLLSPHCYVFSVDQCSYGHGLLSEHWYQCKELPGSIGNCSWLSLICYLQIGSFALVFTAAHQPSEFISEWCLSSSLIVCKSLSNLLLYECLSSCLYGSLLSAHRCLFSLSTLTILLHMAEHVASSGSWASLLTCSECSAPSRKLLLLSWFQVPISREVTHCLCFGHALLSGPINELSLWR